MSSNLKIPVPITVFTPVYNAAQFLRETIDSVLNQTFTDFEFLLIDDASTDNSVEIIKSYADPRIRLIQREENSYIDCFNQGLDEVRGKYMARMDADDIMRPQRLEIQYAYMEANPDVVACGSNSRGFGEGFENVSNAATKYEDLLNIMILGNPIANPSSMIRMETVREHGLYYEEDYIYSDDYKFWFEISKIGKIVNLPEVLIDYRSSPGQVSNVFHGEQKSNAMMIRREAVDYNISSIKDEYYLSREIKTMLMPALDKLVAQGIVSSNNYYNLVYEIVAALRRRGQMNGWASEKSKVESQKKKLVE